MRHSLSPRQVDNRSKKSPSPLKTTELPKSKSDRKSRRKSPHPSKNDEANKCNCSATENHPIKKEPVLELDNNHETRHRSESKTR